MIWFLLCKDHSVNVAVSHLYDVGMNSLKILSYHLLPLNGTDWILIPYFARILRIKRPIEKNISSISHPLEFKLQPSTST